MKKFLQELNCGFTRIQISSKALIALVVMLGGSQIASAQTSGIFESYAILSINGGANTFYDMQAATPNADLQGLNLGNITFGSGSLIVRGGQNKTFKNSGCNINSSAILYRVYPTASPSGSYISINEQFERV